MVAECWLSVATIFRLPNPFDFTVAKFDFFSYVIKLSGMVFKVKLDMNLMTCSFLCSHR